MFYALDLIESYGSGIRRAKRAMAENGSPALMFTPDNETDDYTMATACINEEFASIRRAESVWNTGETVKETVQETVKETAVETEGVDLPAYSSRDRMLKLIADRPSITVRELAASLGLTQRGVRYHIDHLRKAGVIEHVGPTKRGSWKIVGSLPEE